MMEMEIILREQGPPQEVNLTPAEVFWLRRALADRLDIWPTGESGRYLLKARSHVGFVVLPGGRFLVIKPKVPIDALFALLAAVYDPAHNIFQEKPQAYTSVAGLFEFVVRYFVACVEDLVAQGVLHGYRQTAEDLVALRGRLLVTETLRNRPGLNDRHRCAYSRFTADVAENRVLRWTSRCLAALRYQEASLATRLRRIEMALAAVTLDPDARRLSERIEFHRLNEHYRPAMILARLLLDHLSFSGTAGDSPFVAFLVDMDWLFERYLGAVLKQFAGAWDVQVVEQERHTLDHAGQFSVRPDVVLYRCGQPQLVLDAKYKLDEAHGDVYQMLAYCHAVGISKGILVYPASEAAPVGELSIRGPGDALIRYLALDLRGGPEHLEAQAKELCRKVEGWLAATPGRADCTCRVVEEGDRATERF